MLNRSWVSRRPAPPLALRDHRLHQRATRAAALRAGRHAHRPDAPDRIGHVDERGPDDLAPALGHHAAVGLGGQERAREADPVLHRREVRRVAVPDGDVAERLVQHAPDGVGVGRPAGAGHHAARGGGAAHCASSRARANTVVEHRLGEPAGERVLLAGVEAAEQRASARRRAPRRGRSAAAGAAAARPSAARSAQRGVPREGAEADDHAHVAQQRRARAPGRAGSASRSAGSRLVRGRRAAHRGGDARAAQLQAVVARDRRRLVREARRGAARRTASRPSGRR